MKHTKANGEGNTWDVAVHQYNSGKKIVVHAHPTRIALCYSEKYEGLYPSIKEAMANAKLIAAAPELLEAIKYYFDVLEEVRGEDWDKKPDHVLSKMINAINKATK